MRHAPCGSGPRSAQQEIDAAGRSEPRYDACAGRERATARARSLNRSVTVRRGAAGRGSARGAGTIFVWRPRLEKGPVTSRSSAAMMPSTPRHAPAVSCQNIVASSSRSTLF
ncbi:hypothetical protein EVAR_56330_1 [Eumeta japonica]|uniref:Uncharacterized protein n=1 Tax=Eumeta variegata TaxID=151549 RepID=A0A4C1YBF9_EUMVA|nr:hypothetical protein EVAR_56330_1 [Eumeta japonica]